MKPGPKKLYPCRMELTCSYEWRDALDEYRRGKVAKYDPERGIYIGVSRNEAIRTLVTQALEGK